MVKTVLFAGLGNRLFQIASAYGLSRKTDTTFGLAIVCDEPAHNIRVSDYEFLYSRVSTECSLDSTSVLPFLQMSVVIDICAKKELKIETQSTFASEYEDFENKPLSEKSVMFGYFQNEKYFSGEQNRKDILALFKEPTECLAGELIFSAVQKYSHLDLDDMYFIHIRMGDYMYPANRGIHFVDLRTYYKRAIEHIRAIDPNAKFVLFTDSPVAYKKLYSNIEGDIIDIIDEKNPVVAFYMMIRCMKGGICANSTFSWWAAWMNNNPRKIVTIPSKWFNDESAYHRGHVLDMDCATTIDVGE